MRVLVHWAMLRTKHDPRWNDSMCLYAYLHPRDAEVLYVGKADYSTPRRRLSGDHKSALFDDLRTERQITRFRALHGSIIMLDGGRRTSQLIGDVESLVIKRVQPWGNIQSRVSRISRPGLSVECVGAWPLERSRFRDTG